MNTEVRRGRPVRSPLEPIAQTKHEPQAAGKNDGDGKADIQTEERALIGPTARARRAAPQQAASLSEDQGSSGHRGWPSWGFGIDILSQAIAAAADCRC